MSHVSFLIGELLAEQGRITEAKRWFQKALRICDQYDCECEIDIAVILSSLSKVCHAQGKFQEATQLQEHAQNQLCAVRQHLDWQFHRTPVKAADRALIMLATTMAMLWLLTAYILIYREQLPQFMHRTSITIHSKHQQ